MKKSMERSLAVVQLGMTLCAVIAAATGVPGEDQIVPIFRGLGVSPGLAAPLRDGRGSPHRGDHRRANRR